MSISEGRCGHATPSTPITNRPSCRHAFILAIHHSRILPCNNIQPESDKFAQPCDPPQSKLAQYIAGHHKYKDSPLPMNADMTRTATAFDHCQCIDCTP